MDLNTVATVTSILFGFGGFLVGLFSFRWSRHESRLEALSAIMKPLVDAMQALNDANTARRTAERLKLAYPDPEKSPEAVHHVNSQIRNYNKLASAASDAFKEFEHDLACRKFRFPDKVGKTLQAAKEDLAELGQCVNNGSFDQADIYVAKMIDHHKTLSLYARGWRLADPLEGVRNRIARMRKTPVSKPCEHDLTDDQMKQLMDLVHKRATTQAHNPFVIHAPQKLLENPELAESDNVIDELSDSIFEIVFQDGTYAMLSLPELMTFTYQLIFLAQQYAELNVMFRGTEKPAEIKVSYTFAVSNIMRPEIVKTLLSKIEFSKDPSDELGSHATARTAC